MASISTDANGNHAIQFVFRGKRRTLRMGDRPKKYVQKFKLCLDHLLASVELATALDAQAVEWLKGLDDKLYAKLAKLGLCQPRQTAPAVTLKAFTDQYIARRTDAKPRTIINMRAAQRRLVEYFKAEKPLKDVNPGDADAWCLWLRERYADGTAGRTIKRAKQFFKAAVRAKLVDENPFAEVKPPSQTNRKRIHFIDRAAAEKVLEACPSAEWRLIFALSRFGGLRCPSEHLALTWQDIDWDKGTVCIRSPKKEHLDGTGERLIPLFPELRPHLEAAWELAPEGAVHVITRTRDSGVNWRTAFTKIVRRAGLVPWPKLFHNLRASRQNELSESFPIHVVCEWMGNTAAVAAAHYLQVRPEDFDKALQRAAKSAAASVRHEPPMAAKNEKTPEFSGVSSEKPVYFGTVRLPPRGLEPLSSG